MSSPVICPQCGFELSASDAECPRCRSGREPADATTVADSPSADHAAPARVGEYRVLRTIGRGGMGTVYEAFQESMRRKVALKILDAGLFPSNKQVHRFEREAWIAGRLNHPNIVKVFGQGTEGNTHYIAMELLSGRSLQDAIRDAKKSRDEASSSDSAWRTGHVRRTVELFVGLADALGHVHQQGIVHRDIKPGNLLLEDDDSRLLLTDFGLARDVDASRVTRRGDFFGTVRYGDFTEPIEDLGDGEPPGTLVLEPSRELALATRRFVRYVGDTVELPVTVHVETRTAVRVQLEDCPN